MRIQISLCLLTSVVLVGLITLTACTSKIDTTSGTETKQTGVPLAPELQGKPVFADIYASWCPACKNIAPTLSALRQKYKGQVNFVVLDVTDASTTNQSKEKANRLGLAKFFQDNQAATSTVAVIDPSTGNILKQFYNDANETDYTTVIDPLVQSKPADSQ